jgi:flagellar assembly factor FliW
MTIDFSKASAMELAYGNRCALKTVRPENVFSFPEGILGFQKIKDYAFILNDKVKPFLFMQALDGSDICFVCVESFLICPNYHVKLPDAFVESLDIKDPSDVLLLNLVTVRQKVEEISANLVSPLVINIKSRRGRQLIVEGSEFAMRYKIWDAISKSDAIAALAV